MKKEHEVVSEQTKTIGVFAPVGGRGASLHDPGMGQLLISIERTC